MLSHHSILLHRALDSCFLGSVFWVYLDKNYFGGNVAMTVARSPNLRVQGVGSSLILADLDLQMKERWVFPGCKEPVLIDYLFFVILGYLYILSYFSQQVSEL